MIRNLITGALALALSLPLAAQTANTFHRPLHLQRVVHDPIGGATAAIDEYYVGQQVVAVRGARIAIIDHHKLTITEIDRERGTWSERALTPPSATQSQSRRAISVRVREQALDPSGSVRFELDHDELVSLAVRVNRVVRVPRAALAMILGESSFDGFGEGRIIADAAKAGDGEFYLPSRIERRYRLAGEELTALEELRFVAWEAPPSDLLKLPEGARRELSRAERLERALIDIEEPRR